MKNVAYALCISLFVLTSCGSDEDCMAETFEENIVGTWKTPRLGDSSAGTVTFNANGTGKATEGSLFSASLNDEVDTGFDWSYDATTMSLDVDWDFPNGGLGVEFLEVEFDCEETTFNFILNFTIERE